MLLPIVPDEYDPIVKKVKWLISHDEDGNAIRNYRFIDVGEGIQPEDCKVLSRYRENNGLSSAPIIDRELLIHLNIAEYDEAYEEDQYEPFVLGNKWQLALSIGLFILAVILFVI